MLESSLIIDKLQKASLKEVKIVPGDDKVPFYLDVTYTFENLHGVYELHIPKINISGYFPANDIPNIIHHEMEEDPTDFLGRGRINNLIKPRNYSSNFIFPEIDCGGLLLEDPKNLNLNGRGFEVKIIKEKEQEMTLEEIEKKLGHKVKIITK